MAKYMFSKSQCLMCTVGDDGRYYVNNGHWYGTRHKTKLGDIFMVHSPTGDFPIIVDDWVEIESDNMSHEERKSWYI